MNYYSIKREDLKNMLSIIEYLHDKIREKSDASNENLDAISEEAMMELKSIRVDDFQTTSTCDDFDK